MTVSNLDNLIACQAALVAALDKRDVGAIEQATIMLAHAVTVAKSNDAWRSNDEVHDKLVFGLKQTDAARTRINYLSEWTRQRIDSLNELRGISNAGIYSNICNKRIKQKST